MTSKSSSHPERRDTPSRSSEPGRVANFRGHPLYRIDTVTNTLSRMPVGFGGQLVVDRTGSRILVEQGGVGVLDADMVQLGRLEQDFSTSIVATAINVDGTRAYVLLRGDRKLHIYDLTSPPVNGLFAQIGTGVSVPDLAIDGAGRSEMHLSKDEHTLFIVGGAGVVVHGLP